MLTKGLGNLKIKGIKRFVKNTNDYVQRCKKGVKELVGNMRMELGWTRTHWYLPID